MNLDNLRLAVLVMGVSLAVGTAASAQPPGGNIRSPAADEARHFADADNATLTAAGKVIYADQCANCHGLRLQGQPLWQLRDEFYGRRAPAHDETGHTWSHSDEDLFYMTKYGRFATAPVEAHSYMPAFKDDLTDEEILAVMAFIKARWPIGLRLSQAMLNPNQQGMPADAAALEWTLPPTCMEGRAGWRAESR